MASDTGAIFIYTGFDLYEYQYNDALNIEPEMHHVSILHEVFLSFDP